MQKKGFTFFNTTILSSVTFNSPDAVGVVIANGTSSIPSAALTKALANSLSLSAKNPTAATSLPSVKAVTSSAVSRTLAGGPVFLFNQLTISSAVRPPKYIYHSRIELI